MWGPPVQSLWVFPGVSMENNLGHFVLASIWLVLLLVSFISRISLPLTESPYCVIRNNSKSSKCDNSKGHFTVRVPMTIKLIPNIPRNYKKTWTTKKSVTWLFFHPSRVWKEQSDPVAPSAHVSLLGLPMSQYRYWPQGHLGLRLGLAFFSGSYQGVFCWGDR